MANQPLTPTQCVPDNTALNLTSLSGTAMTGFLGVTFNNSGREKLLVNVGATATTATVVIGSTVLGQAVTNFSVVLTTSAINQIGPFHTIDDATGTTTVTITFNQVASVTVGLVQDAGVF
jgi:NADH/NAD ratio-sensing transcriptional regulator Rex